MKLYTDQQSNYNALIKKAKQELDGARSTLEALNQRAADSLAHGTEAPDHDGEETENQQLADAEAVALVNQVQTVLQACAKAAMKEDPAMEISDGEDLPAAPAKRPRSLEPFGGGPVGGAAS